MGHDFASVTETPGTLVSAEALDMVRTRYEIAAGYAAGKSVLEVACGPGPGLGLLATFARRTVAGDYTSSHLEQARAQYGQRVPLVRLDALRLPFADGSFDVVVLFEALYFLPGFDGFLKSCWQVLSKHGILLIASANPEWSDFNPAPLSTRYLSAAELDRTLSDCGFEVTLYGGFSAGANGLRARVISMAKRAAVKLHLIPRTMKGKELLKRIAFGRLRPFPAEVSAATGTVWAPVQLARGVAAPAFKVIYAVARKGDC
jgi:ubiquinone/menaquinone biosynthesis C-methylase UbiE